MKCLGLNGVVLIVTMLVIMEIRLRFMPIVAYSFRGLHVKIRHIEGIIPGIVSIARNCWPLYMGIRLLVNRVILVMIRSVI
jgi:hypothetical protein